MVSLCFCSFLKQLTEKGLINVMSASFYHRVIFHQKDHQNHLFHKNFNDYRNQVLWHDDEFNFSIQSLSSEKRNTSIYF